MVGRRAVASSLTELLLVVIAFAMVFAFSAFVISNVHGIGGSTHRLQIYGDSKLVINKNTGEAYAVIRMYADIKPQIVIDKLLVDRFESTNVTIVQVLQGEPRVENGKLVLPVGSYVIVKFELPPEAADYILPTYWGVVEGRLITESGYLYKVELKVEIVNG